MADELKKNAALNSGGVRQRSKRMTPDISEENQHELAAGVLKQTP
jgi:hypothetical protein